ncbi:hypothetical protein ACRAKI_27665 [Saccharothrix isguenensis]
MLLAAVVVLVGASVLTIVLFAGARDAERISRLEEQNAELRECAVPAKDSIIAARDEDDAAIGPAIARANDNGRPGTPT